MVMGTGELWTLVPFSVAFTNRLRVPDALPAMNTTGFPDEEFRDPRVFVNDHE
jgi:hypothetical protein